MHCWELLRTSHLRLHVGRPNAIKWQGRKIRQPGGGGHGHTRDGVEDDSEEPVSEIRATELIRPGEEIT